ncbi:MAG: glycosyltransferase family 4 protein [Deltaproteobacteria bacterium]|nr:glycosyltransferase family 4 protein [Deltaproteobacteria bacterium]MBW2417808.1 glycosyltransferase family 4 protein [Deltaproteobacteria bacterium]
MRLAMIGAFPFPYPQGSQIFLADQARALCALGAAPVLLTYGRGAGAAPDDLELAPGPRWLSPRAMRSGPQWSKPAADAALAAAYLAEHRRESFDLALAHNAEAAAVALAARPFTGVPVLYVVHTILGWELSAYGPERWRSALDAAGSLVDRAIARQADGILALCRDAAEILAPHSRGRIRVLPPGLDPSPPPSEDTQRESCDRQGLEPGRFVLYTGNLDGYQDLDLLAEAAAELDRQSTEGAARSVPIVVATHDASGSESWLARSPRLRCIQVPDFDEMRALTFAAGVLVLTRRRRGGFPVKLLNYMEAGRPIVAFEGIASGFEHRRNAWLLRRDAGARDVADALVALLDEPALGEALGHVARRHLEEQHSWPTLARRTLEFAEGLCDGARGVPPRLSIPRELR